MEANRELLAHVWMNLMDNAVIFSPENGEIGIYVSRREDTIVAVISNEGNGMDQDTLAHVFDKFYQGDKSHSAEGNGLGKKITELHGGTVSIQSAPGKGAEITVVLPVKQP